MSKPKRVIIDTDPGVDDTMALFLALASPELHIDGITIVHGNHSDLSILSRNACMILQLAGKSNIPVYVGSGKPISREYHGHNGTMVHGEDGIGNLTSLPVKDVDLSPIQKIHAAEFIVHHCEQNSGEITIITLGPLTNLALALKISPNLGKHVHQVVAMAGGISLNPKNQFIAQNRIGNKTPVAEANVNNDPEAAKIVLNSGLDVVLFTINLTHQIIMNKEFLIEIGEYGPIGKFIHDTNQHYSDFYASVGEEVPIHDSTPVMFVIRPDLFSKLINLYVDVETKGELTSGMMIPDWRNQYKKKENVQIYFGVDSAEYLKEYTKRIKYLSELVKIKE